MRLSLAVVIVCLAASAVAYAQSPPAQTPPNATIQSPTAPAAAIPVQAGKRFACQTAAQGFNGQDRRDQMQLCMAQAHLDCLKQAIDQKIAGPQRKEFIKSCAQ